MKRSIGRSSFCAAALLCSAAAAGLAQRSPEAERESAYAASVVQVADSAIRRLDFFPARAQLRVQMLFLAPRDSSSALFDEIARRSVAAAQRVDEISSTFEATRVPDDLGTLHAALIASLHEARAALDRLARAANACQVDAGSVTRCQSPFTAASSGVGQTYKKYLAARERIREQILDTQTVLPEFAVAGKGAIPTPAVPRATRTAMRKD